MESKTMSCFCQHCHEIFIIPSRRGRPPTLCQKCVDGAKKVEHLVTIPKPSVPIDDDNDQEIRTRLQDRRLEDIHRSESHARVDRLEMMLRSRGTHIQQQKGWKN